MLTQSDIQAIGKIVDERLDKQLLNFPTKDDLDRKLKNALRGVVRKKDLRLMENRIIKRINRVADSTDFRLLALEKKVFLQV